MWSVIQASSRLLAKHASLFVLSVGAFAFWLPDTFGWVRGNTQSLVLGFIMLTMGMTLSPHDFRALAKRPWEIACGTVAQYTIMPLLAWALVHCFDLPRGIALGLVLVGCCPGGVSS